MPVKDYIKDAGLKFTGRPKKEMQPTGLCFIMQRHSRHLPADP